MTITFQGHVAEMKRDGSDEMLLTIHTPQDPCDGKPFIARIPAAQAKHWLPGCMVSFTIYALPEIPPK